MKELTFEQMDSVSGAYKDWNSVSNVVDNIGEGIASGVLAFSLGSVFAALIGGTYGGYGGGLIGVGSIGQAVGAIAGAVYGGALLCVAGITVGWEMTLEYCQKGMDGYLNGTWKPVPQ